MHARAQEDAEEAEEAEEEAEEAEEGVQGANGAYRNSAWRRELHHGFPALKLSGLAADLGGLGHWYLSRQSALLALTATSNHWYCSHLRSTTTRNHTPSKPRARGF